MSEIPPLKGPLLDVLLELTVAGAQLFAEGRELRFRAPPGVMTDDVVKLLKANREGVVEYLVRAQGPQRQASPFASSIAAPSHPASFKQSFFFRDETQQEQAAVSCTYDLQEIISIPVLQRALTSICLRHTVLNTRLAWKDGALSQSPGEPKKAQLGHHYAGAMALPARRAHVQKMAAKVRERIAPAEGQGFSATLISFTDDDLALILASHPAIMDAGSLNTLFRELMATYGSFRKEKQASSGDALAQYHDYAIWEAGWLTQEVIGKCLAYWDYQLRGYTAPEPIRRSSGVHAFTRLTFDEDAVRRLAALSSSMNAPPRVLLFSLYASALADWACAPDLVVEYVSRYKPAAELEPALGPFSSHLAVRCDFSDNPTLRQSVGRAFLTIKTAARYGAIGGEVSDAVAAAPRLSFNFFQAPVRKETAQRGIVAGQYLPLSGRPSSYPACVPANLTGGLAFSNTLMSLDAFERESEIECIVKFDIQVFDASSISKIKDKMLNLLDS